MLIKRRLDWIRNINNDTLMFVFVVIYSSECVIVEMWLFGVVD